MRCGLLGERLAHSFSPMIHALLGDYEYHLYEKRPEEIEGFLLRGDFDGLNVTIPYKKAVIPYCRGLSETAKSIGSVNTIIRLKDGSLYGDNTDAFGFSYLLNGIAPGKTLILGSGGSSLTVRSVIPEAVVISRNGENNYKNIYKHYDAQIIVNTTPVGMYPHTGIAAIDIGSFPNCRSLIDLVYNPARTELILQAEELGIRAVNGLAMLAAQAKRAAELFTGGRIPDDRIEAVIRKIEMQTKNIVLIGMPGCGKTTIGAALAKRLGRKFADTDELIEAAAGKPIPAIFSEDGGEEALRKLETGALQELCTQSGLLIATGGGIVTRPHNRRLIRQNSVAVFLDRELSQLPTSGRPLSQQTGIETLAAERLPLYKEWADMTIQARSIEQTVEDLYENFSN
jgi:shikimate dehydrogenase